MSVGNVKLMRKMNMTTILKKIENLAPVSRTKLTKETGLSRTTITTLIDELIKQDVITEVGEGKSKGGRKPILLDFNKKKYFIISAVIFSGGISVALFNLKFKMLMIKKRKIGKSIRQDEIVEILIDLCKDVIANLKTEELLIGLVVGFSGIISQHRDMITFSASLKIKNLHLKQELAKYFYFPIYIENDVNLAALAEKYLVIKSKLKNYLYISIVPQVGGGIIINNEIYRGQYGGAGELGHMIVAKDGPICFCGNKGCLIAVLSSLIAIDTVDEFRTKFLAIKEKGIGSSSVYREFCEYLGIAISNYVKIHDPEAVILGGEIVKLAPDQFYTDIKKIVCNKHFKGIRNIRIIPSKVKENATIIGGAYYCFEKFVQEPQIFFDN